MGRFGHDAEAIADDVSADAGAGGCGLSFAPGTLVATPAGERPIASLTVGNSVTAYDPASHTVQTQTVTATFVNHDRNVVDVTLRVVASQAAASNTTAGKPASTAPSKNLPATTKGQQTHDETVQTTTNHPWLTADHSWEPAGFLRVGEPVVTAGGATAVVVAVRSVPGAADMWDLTVANVHTFAVGAGQFVVHNCDFETFKAKNKGTFGSEDEAKNAYNTANRIKHGNPYKYPNADFENDGEVFQNKEGGLPQRRSNYYREYTVPGPGTEPGADPMLNNRRIVTGGMESFTIRLPTIAPLRSSGFDSVARAR